MNAETEKDKNYKINTEKQNFELHTSLTLYTIIYNNNTRQANVHIF